MASVTPARVDRKLQLKEVLDWLVADGMVDSEAAADLGMQPLREPLGGLNAEPMDEELLGELAVALQLLDALRHLVPDGDGLGRRSARRPSSRLG